MGQSEFAAQPSPSRPPRLPGPVVVDALGITPTTATGRVKGAGGDWANYAGHTPYNRIAQPRKEPHQLQRR